ncbi:MAG: hypothetical protein WBC00_07145 [Candidatus Omnitrophota bacterium]
MGKASITADNSNPWWYYKRGKVTGTINRSKNLKVDAVLQKPVDLHELLQKVNTLLPSKI